MQGRKKFTPRLFYELSLDGLVPADNFYRRVNQELDLHFLYKSTQNIMEPKVRKVLIPSCFLRFYWLAI